jgi:secondary thiamine-phosphate synthase enzyme
LRCEAGKIQAIDYFWNAFNTPVMKFYQREISFPAFPRGFHLITSDIIKVMPEIREIKTGQLHVFIRHTSAGLTINENVDPTVRKDFETHFNKLVPEDAPYYRHNMEGPDDMPAHIKASLMGASVTIPITNGLLMRTPQPRRQPGNSCYSVWSLAHQGLM